MSKGTNLQDYHTRGVLFGESEEKLPEELGSRLITREGLRIDKQDLLRGISKVLAFGLSPAMRRNIEHKTAIMTSNKAVKALLSGQVDGSILVPSFNTAIIRHRSNKDMAIVLANGRMLGHVALKNAGTITSLSLVPRYYEDPSLNSLAHKGIMALAVPMIADEIANETIIPLRGKGISPEKEKEKVI